VRSRSGFCFCFSFSLFLYNFNPSGLRVPHCGHRLRFYSTTRPRAARKASSVPIGVYALHHIHINL
jgi:hypothetical protein